MKLKIALVCFSLITLFISPIHGQSNDASEDVQLVAVEKEEEGFVFTHGERRQDSPFQIQIVHTFAAATPNGFAPGAGLHLGYQLSDMFYLGLTSSAYFNGENAWDKERRYDYDEEEEEDEYEYNRGRTYGQEGVEETESELDPVHLLELRITPWDFGLYFSFGAMYRGEQVSTTRFKTEKRDVGENTYTTGLEATVAYDEWYGAATGIGFNYIFDCGLTMGSALNVALGHQSAEVEVSADTNVSEDDLDYWQNQIEANEGQTPYLFTLSLGYAF